MFEEDGTEAWNAFVNHCAEAWVFHTAEFVKAASYDYSFSIVLDGVVRGVCVLGRERRRLGSYLVGPGLALDESAQSEPVWRAVRKQLRALARRAGCDAVEFTLPPMAPANWSHTFETSHLKALGFSAGMRWRWAWEPLPAYVSVIHLGNELSEILREFHKGQKSNVRRCERLGFRCKALTGAEITETAWCEFEEIHRIRYARSGGRGFSARRLAHLFELAKQGKLILLCGYQESECIAAILVAADRQAAFYYAGGARDEARKNGAMAWIQYESIRCLKERGYRYYCLGFTVPELSGTASGGIGDFKKRFGGEQWPMLCGDLVCRRSGFLLKHIGHDLARRVARIFAKSNSE